MAFKCYLMKVTRVYMLRYNNVNVNRKGKWCNFIIVFLVPLTYPMKEQSRQDILIRNVRYYQKFLTNG